MHQIDVEYVYMNSNIGGVHQYSSIFMVKFISIACIAIIFLIDICSSKVAQSFSS
jgi:hypothetical protein